MALKDKEVFIRELAAGHKQRRPLMLPWLRTVLWFVLSFVLSAVLMHSVQVFRPGFGDQLLHHPVFLLEILSAFLIAFLGARIVLEASIPGEGKQKGLVVALWISTLLFIIVLAAGFTRFAPETSHLGARHACWQEVIIYGAVCLVVFLAAVRRGLVRFSVKIGLLYGLVAGFVPATLMQLACIYDPFHAIVFHYLPVIVLIPFGLVAMRIMRR